MADVDTRNELREFLTIANRAVGLSRFGPPEILGVHGETGRAVERDQSSVHPGHGPGG